MIRVRVLRDGQEVQDAAMADPAAVRAQPGTLTWVEDYQEVLAGTLEANATLASNRVNTVACNLAADAAIFAVVTMISGSYGMNFHHMPELSWRFGYAWSVG